MRAQDRSNLTMSAQRRLHDHPPGTPEFNRAWADMEESLYPAVAIPSYRPSRLRPGVIEFEGVEAWVPYSYKPKRPILNTQLYIMHVVVVQTADGEWHIRKHRHRIQGNTVELHPDVAEELENR